MNGEQKPAIDERLKALAESLELLTHDVHEMQAAMARLDRRERQARTALMTGIAAYIQALQDDEEEAK